MHKMTGYTVMEPTVSPTSSAENINALNYELSSFPKPSSVSRKTNDDNNIATLDVTPEEITLDHISWKHAPLNGSDFAINDDCRDVERKRSETWSSGHTEQPHDFKNLNTFYSDFTLDHTNYMQDAQQCNGFVDNPELSSTHFMSKFEKLRRQSLNIDSKDKNKSVKQSDLIHSMTENVAISKKQAPVNNNHISVVESCKQTLEQQTVATDVELQSEFTDINLQTTEDEHNSNESMPSLNNAKHSSRPSIGSIFGWIANTKAPSESGQINSIRSVGNSPTVDLNMSNTSITDCVDVVTELDSVNVPPLAAGHTNTSGNQGIKTVGKSLKATFSSKTRFWRSRFVEPLSTTALILENRPSHLPSKSAEEYERHKQEYEKMVENARKHEYRDVQKQKKLIKLQRKHEDTVASASTVWAAEILPNWSTMSQTNRTKQLWWQGLPPNVRGKVWQLAIGNELNLTQDLYDIMITRAHEKLRSLHETQSMGGEDTESLAADRESTVELIRLDISRTFPNLCIFQKGGPYHDVLHDILGAYVCYRPDVGYVQGMSFIAAMLLLNMEPADAFVTFANLMNKPCQVAFFRLNEEMMKSYFATFEVFFEENLPKLFAHFKLHNLTPDMYLIDWIFTMFSKSLSLDTASRVWDVFCRDGEELLFKTAIAILKVHEEALLKMEFIHAAQFLTRLPAAEFSQQQLFDHMTDVTMVSRGNRRWKDVLSLMRDST
ncbi:TBC1 domain family member 12-like [Clavelina lepadiformis]|uniref:TBC1 domain family member 12-like n=1 Tax=Clavelina lepadiformis TaxID=159417 RepID=UPI00404154DF